MPIWFFKKENTLELLYQQKEARLLAQMELQAELDLIEKKINFFKEKEQEKQSEVLVYSSNGLENAR